MPDQLRKETLVFADSLSASAVFARPNTSPLDIFEALSLNPKPQAVISVSGGAGDFPKTLDDPIKNLFRSIVTSLPISSNILFVDGGTNAGVMRALGQALQSASIGKPHLVGFTPELLVRYPGTTSEATEDLESNHSHFVLVQEVSQWGHEIESMFSFLRYLNSERLLPVVSLVVNGGKATIKEAHRAASLGYPLIVLEGTQRAADLIVEASINIASNDWRDKIEGCGVADKQQDIDEIIDCLLFIAEYPRLIRFDVQNHPPEELSLLIAQFLT